MTTHSLPPDIADEVRAAHKEDREVELTPAQMKWLGHRKQNPVRAMRSFCLSCMGGDSAQVRKCTSPACSLFPYRLNRNPFTDRKGGFSER